MTEAINRILILEKNIRGNLKKCKTCNVNFTALDNCIICQLILEKQEKLGRKLTKEEFNDIIKEFR